MNDLPDTMEAWGAALDGEAVPIEELLKRQKAELLKEATKHKTDQAEDVQED